ncbi:MAG: hypothetical protein ABUT20_28405 [Bacteroidota bacterium]
MKKIIITILLLTPFVCIGQNYDSLKQKILKMDIAINTIHQNMVKSDSEYKTGTIFVLSGAAMAICSNFLLTEKKHADVKSKGIILGLSLIGIGTVIHIHSHRFLGKGARK